MLPTSFLPIGPCLVQDPAQSTSERKHVMDVSHHSLMSLGATSSVYCEAPVTVVQCSPCPWLDSVGNTDEQVAH